MRHLAVLLLASAAACTSAKPPGDPVRDGLYVAVVADRGEDIERFSKQVLAEPGDVMVTTEQLSSRRLPPRPTINMRAADEASVRKPIETFRIPGDFALAYGQHGEDAAADLPWQLYVLRTDERFDLGPDTRARLDEPSAEAMGVLLTFGKDAAAAFSRLCEKHEGDYIAIAHEDRVIMAPRLDLPECDRQVFISMGGEPAFAQGKAQAMLGDLVAP